MINAILLDLDGTLLDTAGDLGTALNRLLIEHQLPVIPLDIIRPEAGSGCRGLLKLGMNIEPDDKRYPLLSEQLLEFYQCHLLETTKLFPGMENTLAFLEKKGIPWGIVTNKPTRYTDQLLAHLKLDKRAACVISGDTLAKRKPHPEPILHACELLRQDPRHCLYVGDSRVDIQACKAAGSPSLAALYGYIPAGEDPLSWGADGYINHSEEMIQWVI
ncbi:MAG TPA: phosphoglycolate phosphatase [Gammaproteobacteria bacterium]|nr:phosphoglycolate phosphatase [Gammaproteobacteria bacterium]